MSCSNSARKSRVTYHELFEFFDNNLIEYEEAPRYYDNVVEYFKDGHYDLRGKRVKIVLLRLIRIANAYLLRDFRSEFASEEGIARAQLIDLWELAWSPTEDNKVEIILTLKPNFRSVFIVDAESNVMEQHNEENVELAPSGSLPLCIGEALSF